MAAAFALDHILVVTGSPRADNRIDNTAGLSSTLGDSFLSVVNPKKPNAH
jgi:hypothetical protein